MGVCGDRSLLATSTVRNIIRQLKIGEFQELNKCGWDAGGSHGFQPQHLHRKRPALAKRELPELRFLNRPTLKVCAKARPINGEGVGFVQEFLLSSWMNEFRP